MSRRLLLIACFAAPWALAKPPRPPRREPAAWQSASRERLGEARAYLKIASAESRIRRGESRSEGARKPPAPDER